MELRLGGLLLVGVLVAACAGGGASPTAAPSTTAPPPSATPAATAAPSAPAPPPSVSPPVTAAPSPSPAPSASDEAWDLLWVSPSTGSGGVPEAYARRIEADLGVSVRVHDAWTMNLSARTVLKTLRGMNDGILMSSGSGEVNLPELVRDAEVIVVQGSPTDSPTASHPWDYHCPDYVGPNPVCGSNTSCGPETWVQYEADLVAIFDEIFRIRGGRPVILRTADIYLPWGAAAGWQACDQVRICAACFGEFSDAIHRAAAARGVPVAGYYAAFSGPNGDQPLPSDWTRDELHPSEMGAVALAGVMADLGYEPVAPTGH